MRSAVVARREGPDSEACEHAIGTTEDGHRPAPFRVHGGQHPRAGTQLSAGPSVAANGGRELAPSPGIG